MMAHSATHINWKYAGDSIPAFVTMVLMPFTYSIANGLIAGICTYIAINVTVWAIARLSGGRIVPPNMHEKEPWSWRGGARGHAASVPFWPTWVRRLGQRMGRRQSAGPAAAAAADAAATSARRRPYIAGRDIHDMIEGGSGIAHADDSLPDPHGGRHYMRDECAKEPSIRSTDAPARPSQASVDASMCTDADVKHR
jgi:hypothetical protein